MLRLFNNNMVLQVVVVLAAALLLWVPSLATPEPMPSGGGTAPIYDLVYGWLNGLPRLAVIVALVLVIAEGLLLNLLLTSVGLTSQTSLLPTLLYIIMMGAYSCTLTPMVLVNGVLIACANQLMLRGTLLTIPPGKICNATALVGICTMIYTPSLTLLAAFLLVVVSYRLYGWKEWTSMVLGFVAPYLLLCAIYFMNGQLTEWWSNVSANMNSFGMQIGQFTTLQGFANGWLVGIMLVALVALLGIAGEKTVLWQKNATVVILLTLSGVLMLLFSTLFPVNMQFFAITFTLTGAYLFAVNNRSGIVGRRTRGKQRREWILNILFILTYIAAFLC